MSTTFLVSIPTWAAKSESHRLIPPQPPSVAAQVCERSAKLLVLIYIPGQTLTSSFSGEDDYSVLTKDLPETRKIKFATIRCKAIGTEGRQELVEESDPKDPSGECGLELGGKIEVTTLILSLGDRGRSKDVSKVSAAY